MSDILSVCAWRRWLVWPVLLALGACSSTHAPDPSPLVALPATGQKTLQRVWSLQLPSVSYPAELAQQGDQVVVGGDDGQVATVRLDDGRVVSRLEAGAHLSAAPGRDGALTAVVTTQNELKVFNDDHLIWHTRLPTQVVTPPLVAGERVFVVGVDRTVYALDALDGRKLWLYQRPSEPLALRQAGVLAAVGDTLWAGVGPRLMALDPTTGAVRQEVVIGTPRGTNEVERLADLVAPPARVEDHLAGQDTLCVRAYQLAVGCVDALRGRLMWAAPQTGLIGPAADARMVVGADGSDRVEAWSLSDGQSLWRNERLTYRGLSHPVLLEQGVVVGDAQGYLHVLDRNDGHEVGRVEACSSAVVALRGHGGRVVAQCRDGTLAAYTLQ